jgi:uncharacterized membrane protein YdjX (TVP38/TMEM64 family)
MNRITTKTRWLLLGAVAFCGVVVCGALAWWLQGQGYGVRESVDWVLAQVRGLGPVAFFSAMALLPGVGVPVSVFTLTAGPVFAPVMGLPLVVVVSLLCLGLNLVLTYGLARWVLRPWAERLCAWLGFKIPRVAPEDQRSLTILVRVTPGPPYVLQNYLLGVARVSFPTYFTISWAVVSLYSTAVIIFGDALVNGKGRGALIAVGLLVAFVVGVRFARKRLNRSKSGVVGAVAE